VDVSPKLDGKDFVHLSHFGVRVLLLLTDRAVLYQSVRPVERCKMEEHVPINDVSTTVRRRRYFSGHADVRILSRHYAY